MREYTPQRCEQVFGFCFDYSKIDFISPYDTENHSFWITINGGSQFFVLSTLEAEHRNSETLFNLYNHLVKSFGDYNGFSVKTRLSLLEADNG